jgi:hypothetical protein
VTVPGKTVTPSNLKFESSGGEQVSKSERNAKFKWINEQDKGSPELKQVKIWAPDLGYLRFGSSVLPFGFAQVGESFDSAQDREPVERPVKPFRGSDFAATFSAPSLK